MAETQVAPRFRGIVLPDALGRLTALQWMAVIATAVTFSVYVATALRGVSFGDWAEMQVVPARFEVPHETGFPLYVLLTRAFTLLPVGSMAFRATLVSVTAAAGSIGLFVLIAGRMGVRPVIALAAGIALAGTATLWEEATFPEMNTLHLFLSALLLHRALVWRAERRDRDLRLGALFSGLALSNHLLALSVVPVVILFVLAEDRLRILRRPRLVLELLLLFLAGLSFYLFIAVRALTGPAALYHDLRSVDGFLAFVSGAQFRIDMRFGTPASLAEAWRAVPELLAGIQQRANIAFSLVPLAGAVILVVRDRWAGWLTIAIVAANVYLFVGYRGDLPHYLLVTWFVLALWLAVAVEAAIGWLRARVGVGFEEFEFGLMAVAAIFLVSNWSAHDQSANRLGEEYTQAVLDRLPPNAVLVTYWDTLTALSYRHCIEGERPDIAVIAHDRPLTASCDLITEPLDIVARTRPIYALEVFERSLDRLRPSFDFTEVATIKVPYGDRFPEFTRPLYRLEPKRP
jgi:4-amino-4-deoxy-L-arabinose transferase-like glycosyltransferase